MGKRNTGWDPSVLRRYLKEGRGSGDGMNYKPWITTHDIASKGCCVRILGRTVPRIYHLLSHLEMNFFYQLDHDPNITDIKEQFPLDVELTMKLALDAGIKHPQMNGYPIVVTTDFLYCEKGTWQAVAVKPSPKLSDERVREKLELERLYWEKCQTDWKIVTEQELNKILTRNLQWLWAGEDFSVLVPSEQQRNGLRKAFLELYSNLSIPFTSIIEVIENECHLKAGTMLQLFKELIRSDQIQIDLTRKINIVEPRVLMPACV